MFGASEGVSWLFNASLGALMETTSLQHLGTSRSLLTINGLNSSINKGFAAIELVCDSFSQGQITELNAEVDLYQTNNTENDALAGLKAESLGISRYDKKAVYFYPTTRHWLSIGIGGIGRVVRML